MKGPQTYLNLAKDKLKENDDGLLAYVCLDLRMCIEAVTMRKVGVYKKYLPESLKLEWRPHTFFKLLSLLEPNAVSGFTLSIGKEDTPGVPAKTMFMLGEHKIFPLGWLGKAYGKLGNFLHIPSKEIDCLKLRSDLEEMVDYLEPIVSSKVDCSMGTRMKMSCAACGDYFYWNVASGLREFDCFNSKCGILNKIVEDSDGSWRCYPSYCFNCECCKDTISFKKRDLRLGYEFSCIKCKQQYQVCEFGIRQVGSIKK